jgi:hypothetical protein
MLSRNRPILLTSGFDNNFNRQDKRSLDLVREADSQETTNQYSLTYDMNSGRPNKKQMREQWNNGDPLSSHTEKFGQGIATVPRMNDLSFAQGPQIHDTARPDVSMEDKAKESEEKLNTLTEDLEHIPDVLMEDTTEDSERKLNTLREDLRNVPQLSKLSTWPSPGDETYTTLHLLADAAETRDYEASGIPKIESSTFLLAGELPITQKVIKANHGLGENQTRSPPHSRSPESGSSDSVRTPSKQIKKEEIPSPPLSRDGSNQGLQPDGPQISARSASIQDPSTQEESGTASELDVLEAAPLGALKTEEIRPVRHDEDAIKAAKTLCSIVQKEIVLQKIRGQNARLDRYMPVATSLSNSVEGRNTKHITGFGNLVNTSTNFSAPSQETDRALIAANKYEAGYNSDETLIDERYVIPE